LKTKHLWLFGAAILAYLLWNKSKATPVPTATITTTVDTPTDVTYG